MRRPLGELPFRDLTGDEVCTHCGARGEIVWMDEIATGWNGALSDAGTDHQITACAKCGELWHGMA